MIVDWPKLKKALYKIVEKRGLDDVYRQRLDLEVSEIEKQGLQRRWVDVFTQGTRFDHNSNKILIPWLLNRIDGEDNTDPIQNRDWPLVLSTDYKYISDLVSKHGKMPKDVKLDTDKPDIDIDCLPDARAPIKEYASVRYGAENVASVGTWTTYLFKNALVDAYVALGLADTESDEQYKELGVRQFAGQYLATQVTTALEHDESIDEIKNGGIGKCKGTVIIDGKEQECGYEHTLEECPSCGSSESESPTIGMAMKSHEILRKFASLSDKHQRALNIAVRLIGCVKNAGKHAGAIIISDRKLLGNVPLTYDAKNDQWVSMWTEGRNTQLSKFGYIKWDILGLKTLKYIHSCCKMIEDNHGISFGEGLIGLDDPNPRKDLAGVYWKDGVEHEIRLNDPDAIRLANELRVDAIFQFDTSLAMETLRNRVFNFNDLLIFNAMGHPGPMQFIPQYVARRDGKDTTWSDNMHPIMLEVLRDTQGCVVYQEQLAKLLVRVGGFSNVEAQEARKAVAKKWREKLKPVEIRWIEGASKILGENQAKSWWDALEKFGRYAFNESHAVAYCLWAYRCLWLKAHYPEEWYASVLGYAHPDKLPRYMVAARRDGIKFSEVNIDRITIHPVANAGKNAVDGQPGIAIGLINLKKVGDKMAPKFADDDAKIVEGGFKDIDDFVTRRGANRTIMERLIKLGSFRKLHPNARATWMWYLHQYGTGSVTLNGKSMTVAKLKAHHRTLLLANEGWTDEKIVKERQKLIDEYKEQFPKRTKIPAKWTNWSPKPKETREAVMSLYPDDYELEDMLSFEIEFLGYYWHSPCDLYHITPGRTVEDAKINGKLEGIVTSVIRGMTKTNKPLLKLHISDGKDECLVMIWDSELKNQDVKLFVKDKGVRLTVDYDEDRNSFVLRRGTVISPLTTQKEWLDAQEASAV